METKGEILMINQFETPSFSMWLTFRQGGRIVCEAMLPDLITAPSVGNTVSYTDDATQRYYHGVVAHRRDAYTRRDNRIYTTIHIIADIPPLEMVEAIAAEAVAAS